MVSVPINLVVASPRPLDCQAISLVIAAHRHLRVLASEATLPAAIEACEKYSPDILLIGPGFREERTIEDASAWLQNGAMKLVAFLDDTYAAGRAIRVSHVNRCSYLTRQQTLDDIFDSLNTDLTSLEDLAANHATPTIDLSRHTQEILEHDQFGVCRLTRREREVMIAIARGRTVKETATLLGLADSTVDNHKSRLMKKLNVHKIAELVSLALETGLVDPLVTSRKASVGPPKRVARTERIS